MIEYKEILEYASIANEAKADTMLDTVEEMLNDLLKINHTKGEFARYGVEIQFDNGKNDIVAVKYDKKQNSAMPWMTFPGQSGEESFKGVAVEELVAHIIKVVEKLK